jgi:hypothetical protein
MKSEGLLREAFLLGSSYNTLPPFLRKKMMSIKKSKEFFVNENSKLGQSADAVHPVLYP